MSPKVRYSWHQAKETRQGLSLTFTLCWGCSPPAPGKLSVKAARDLRMRAAPAGKRSPGRAAVTDLWLTLEGSRGK